MGCLPLGQSAGEVVVLMKVGALVGDEVESFVCWPVARACEWKCPGRVSNIHAQIAMSRGGCRLEVSAKVVGRVGYFG